MLRYFYQFSWAAPATWPDDIGEFVFLARAVEGIGRRIYGKEWTGNEFAMAHPPASLPLVQDKAGWGDRDVAHAILTDSRLFTDLPAPPQRDPPELASPEALEAFAHLSDRRFRQLGIGARPDDRHARNTKSACTFSDEQWSTAVRLHEEKRQRAINGRTRFTTAQTKVAEAIALRRVVGVLKEEAALIPSIGLDAAIWNINHHDGLRDCSITVDVKVNPHLASDRRRLWIFVTRESLDAFKKTQRPLEIAAQVKTHAGGRGAFEQRFTELVAASPDVRTHSREELADLAREFELSPRQALLSRAVVLRNQTESVRKVWERGGRPKKRAIDTA